MISQQRQSTLYAAISGFYADYYDTLENKDLMGWVEFLAQDCLYKVTSRENIQHEWPLCLILCENRNMAYDRAVALQNSIYFRQCIQQYMVSNLRITKTEDCGSFMQVSVTSSFTVYKSINGQEATLLVTGKTSDLLMMNDTQTVFKQRICVCSPDIISDSIIYPL